MLVSVIIPCYKQSRFLKECAHSLLEQSHSKWEALIIDDGSPDETKSVAENLIKVDKRIKYIPKINGGLSSARNCGLRYATGDAVQFLDADDLLEPDKFKFQVEYLEKNHDIDIVYGSSFYFNDDDHFRRGYLNAFLDGHKDRDWIAERAAGTTSPLRALFRHNLFPVCTPLTRMSAVKKLRSKEYFPENLKALEDWHFWTQLAANKSKFAFKTGKCAASLVRVHAQSMTNDRERMNDALLMLQHYQLDLAEDLTDRVFLISEITRYIGKLNDEKFRSEFCILKNKKLRTFEHIALNIGKIHRNHPKISRTLRIFNDMLPWRVTAISNNFQSPRHQTVI